MKEGLYRHLRTIQIPSKYGNSCSDPCPGPGPLACKCEFQLNKIRYAIKHRSNGKDTFSYSGDSRMFKLCSVFSKDG